MKRAGKIGLFALALIIGYDAGFTAAVWLERDMKR